MAYKLFISDSTKTNRLLALSFYGVIVDEGEDRAGNLIVNCKGTLDDSYDNDYEI